MLLWFSGLYGHTSVFHDDDESDGSHDAVYVFGGYQYQTDKTLISNSLYAMVIVSSNQVEWSLLPPEVGNSVCCTCHILKREDA